MKRIFLAASLVICLNASAASLQNAVDNLINKIDPNMNIGVQVLDLSTGDELYQRNSTRSFIPASNMKLFSDAAALMALGPDYRFKTQLSTNAPILEHGTLKGSIYLHFQGDPSFTSDQLEELLSQLTHWGVHRIQGNVVLVSDNSNVSPYAPGWSPKDFKYSYGAPIAPLALDENRLLVTINPSHQVGQPALIEYPYPNAVHLNNQVKTSAKAKGCGIDVNMDHDNNLRVSGCIGVGQWAEQAKIAIQNPFQYTQEVIKQQLNQLQIRLDGQVVLGSVPAGSLLIATHDSKPISYLLADTLKPSDNLYADSLFLHAAAKIHGAPLNWQQAQPVVKNFLQQQTGINLQNAVLTDGSGLSRQDLLTPQQTVGLLQFLHERFPLSYEYIAALPIAGRDGTLQRRLRLPSQQGFVRAKTGTMAGIIGLSGYLYTANAHTLAFAIFINRTPKTKAEVAWRFRPLVDTLCDFFLKQHLDNHRFYDSTKAHSRVAFQQKPAAAEQFRNKKARWRGLESSIKRSLSGQAVSVLFQNDQLVLNDHNSDPNRVWTALQNVRRKYAFAVALQSKTPPRGNSSPFLLWIKSPAQGALRVWTIRETA
jgi:D-alanyl-D-alanine carboxypeptidase/D-alanyl-D-alanine-endopeptidase (penicillin-binding protein 4)